MEVKSEKNAIKEVIQRYIDGTFRGDKAMLESVFHKKAVMNGYLGQELVLDDPSPFIVDVTSTPTMECENDPYHAEITSIIITGNVAAVVLSESGFRSTTSLVDFFHLIKTDDKWEIISKLFTTL